MADSASLAVWRRRLERLACAVRYHRPGQLGRRAAALLRARVDRRRLTSGWAGGAVGPLQSRDVLARIGARRRQLAGGGGPASRPPLGNPVSDRGERSPGPTAASVGRRLSFLGRPVECGAPLAWRSEAILRQPRLWRFHLHYHEWLFELTADPSGGEAWWSDVLSWIEAFGSVPLSEAGDAMHPFCISRRLPVWLCLLALHDSLPADVTRGMLTSAANQAEFLSRRLERELGGNHRLENGRGLAFAGWGLDVPEAARWRTLAEGILRQELPEQVLPHGEHFERSPAYHVEMLELLREVAQLTAAGALGLSKLCSDHAASMAGFLESILHPDGDIPLLGDSELLGPDRIRPLISSPVSPPAEDPQVLRTAVHGGYWTVRRGDDFLLFDAAPAGPDHLPAHAHADLLTVDASIDGDRLLVDSGVFDYEDGDMRAYCRSSAAHNVLEIDGQNQCDVYGRFRMGVRGWPSALHHGTAAGAVWSGATHNAYRRLGAPTVGRFLHGAGEDWLIVDWVLGVRRHRFINRLHVHPDRPVMRLGDRDVQIGTSRGAVFLMALGSGELELGAGWWCPRFGERQANVVLEQQAEGAPPCVLGWLLSRRPATTRPRLSFSPGVVFVDGAPGTTERLAVCAATGRLLEEPPV